MDPGCRCHPGRADSARLLFRFLISLTRPILISQFRIVRKRTRLREVRLVHRHRTWRAGFIWPRGRDIRIVWTIRSTAFWKVRTISGTISRTATIVRRTLATIARIVRPAVSVARVIARPAVAVTRFSVARVSVAAVWIAAGVVVVVRDIDVVVVLDRTAVVVAVAAAVPIAAPVVVAVVDQRAEQDSRAERQHSRQQQIAARVSRGRCHRRSVRAGRIVLRYVNRIRLRGLDDHSLLQLTAAVAPCSAAAGGAGWVSTVCWEVLLRVPAATALLRMTWIAFITSPG